MKTPSLGIEWSKLLGQEVKGLMWNKLRGFCRVHCLGLPKSLGFYHQATLHIKSLFKTLLVGKSLNINSPLTSPLRTFSTYLKYLLEFLFVFLTPYFSCFFKIKLCIQIIDEDAWGKLIPPATLGASKEQNFVYVSVYKARSWHGAWFTVGLSVKWLNEPATYWLMWSLWPKNYVCLITSRDHMSQRAPHLRGCHGLNGSPHGD